MVRETRHLWVGNLPENIREDRIREHFKRYGRVQSVKLLPRAKEDEGSTGLCATVAFMDIKSASKAHNTEQKLDERSLSTEYYEPPIPGSSAYVAPRFPHGVSEEHAVFDRALFYERPRDAGDAYLRRPPASAYHVTGDPVRVRGRDRIYRNGPLPYAQIIDRPPPPHHRAPPGGNAWNYEAPPTARYPVALPVVEPYSEERREPPPVVHKKRPKSSRSGSESASNSASSRSRSRSRSRSSSSTSNSRSSSCSSGTSSPVDGSPHSSRTARSGRLGGVAVQSTVSAPQTNNSSPSVHSEDRRPLAICVRNLPIRSSDTSLKDGLFHEYKKHGKVTWVKVVGQGTDRYALVCFKKPEDVEKALEVSHDKLFFGCKIEVASYQGYDVDDNESRPYEAELDEYHPKATRTLFIGNLEKDVTASELRKHFEQFGEIIEIDIKKQGSAASYAFCQYADIASVVKAMRTMDGEHLGNNRIKLGFGKSMPTNCVWVDGVADNVSEKYLNVQFNQFGSISHVTIDRERGHALIYFEQIPYAQEAVRDMRGVTQRGRKLQVDFASRECQEMFYEHLEKQGHAVVGGERPWDRYDNNREVQASRFELPTVVVPGARFQRYDAGSATVRPRQPTAYVRASPAPAAVAGATPAAGRGAGRALRALGQRYTEYYDTSEYPERRFSRGYDDVSQGSPSSHDGAFEHPEYYCSRTSPSQACAVAVVLDKVSEEDGYKRLQSVVVTDVISPPLPPPDMRHLQKERVLLLEQLEECPSSGDDDVAPKKRPKVMVDSGLANNCVDSLHHDIPPVHNHRKSISEVRRLSDASLKHCPRRPSADGATRLMDVPLAYAPHAICKRRKTGSSASEGEDRCRKHMHHHHHHSGELESLDGSRPGTPLCDERPENLLPPSEPRRPRERSSEGPLSLPLPKFASQVLTQRVLAGKPIIVSPPTITSPRVPVPHLPPSPTPAPPPSSPPPRQPSLPSPSSSDSEHGPPSPTGTLEERIRSLDEKYEKWSGSRNIPAPSETLAKLDAAGDRFRFRHKLLDLNELKPSDIVKSVLAKPSVFDEDSKRLENVGDKYEPKEFAGYKGQGCFQSLRIKTECGTTVKAPAASPGPTAKPVSFPSPAIPTRLMNLPSPLHSPNQPVPKSPFSTTTPTTPTAKTPLLSPGVSPTTPQPCKGASIPKTGALSPRQAGTGIPAAKGLQYPFPSHPPVLPTTTVATTTATTTNVIALVSVSVSIPTSATIISEVCRTSVAKPIGIPVYQNDPRSRVAPPICVLTTATATKPSPEVTCRVQVPQINNVFPPVKVQTPLNVRLAGCVKSNVTVAIPSSIPSTEVFRTSPVTSVLGCEVLFPVGPATPTTPLGSVKKPCATTVAPTSAPRISPAGTTRPCTVSTTPPNTPTSVPSSLRLAVKSSEHSPKTYNSLPVRLDSINIPSSDAPLAVKTMTTCSLVTSSSPVTTSTTTALPAAMTTTAVSATTNEITVHSDQTKQTQKPKTVPSSKPQMPAIKKEGSNPKKEKEESKILSSHRSKSLEEKKDKRDAAGAVCHRRESEGVDRRSDKDKKREKETSDSWDGKKKDVARRSQWEAADNEWDGRKESVDAEKDHRKNSMDSDRLVWNDKDTSETSNKGKSRDSDIAEPMEKKKDFPDERWRDNHSTENTVKERWKEKEASFDKDKKKENYVDHPRDEKVEDVKFVLSKDSEHIEHLDRRKDHDQPATTDKKREKDISEVAQRRKSTDNSEKRKSRDSPEHAERRKDRDTNHVEKRKDPGDNAEKKKDSADAGERRKERDSGESLWSEEKRKERESEEKRKDRRRERASSVNSPATVGCKRRISSQDSVENEDAKKPKLIERRDSKDSGRSSSSSSKRGPHHSFAKPHEDKAKHEADRKRHDYEKVRDKLKKKRDSLKLGKETREERETSTSPRLIKRKDDSDTEEYHHKRDPLEKKKVKDEFPPVECTDERARSAKKDREKRGSSEKRKDDTQSPTKDEKFAAMKKESRIHKMSNSDSDTDDENSPKKHSIFDIVDDGPAYISMYDKVKARSTKNMQKQEEEKRQEKMREKFNLLKASRAKREEKKRSTSWDEDSDSDMDPELRRAKRAGKPVISSSSEDEDGRRHSYEDDESKKTMVSIKKEDLGLGDSDSDSHHRLSKSHEDDGNAMKHLLSAMRKGSRAKLISDTSDDDVHAAFKPNLMSELYSAESDADLGFADSDDPHPSLRKTSIKNHKLNKSVMDSLCDETIRKPIAEISKYTKEKCSAMKKVVIKSKSQKGSLEWSDEEKCKALEEPSKVEFDEEKLAAIFKPRSNNKIKPVKSNYNSSDDEHTRKVLTDAVRAELFGEEKALFNKKLNNKTKTVKRCLDSSDDELVRKLQTNPSKVEGNVSIKNKAAKCSPDLVDGLSSKFISENDQTQTCNDVVLVDKYNSQMKNVDHNLITPPQIQKKSLFFENSTDKSSDRKKAHKKKQKRLKDLLSGGEAPSKLKDIQENHIESKSKSEKKHKRERRKSDHGEDQNKLNKIRKKKSQKQDISPGKQESSLKREEKMEDIFGPISDDSESGIHSVSKGLPTLHSNGGRSFDKPHSKWQVSTIYSSDSDSADRSSAAIMSTPVRPPEKERKRRDKKRRDRKSRQEDMIGVELAEAGRAIEAKLLGTNDPSAEVKLEPAEVDSSRFSDADVNLETTTALLLEKAKEKEKKKKRKKSKEEKQNKHHHHHHHDKSKSSVDIKTSISSEEAGLSAPPAPSLPSLDSTDKVHSDTLSVVSPAVNMIPCTISPRSMDKKKSDKFIPGLMDAAVHETAVKSISNFEPEKMTKVEIAKKAMLTKESEDAEGEDEKPRVVISQEETEDAVAALLGESFGADFMDCYDGNGSPHHHANSGANQPLLQTDEEEETRQAVEGLIDMKPDTPQSEPDLQIDTDTEEEDGGFSGLRFSGDENHSRNSDNIDFSKPPKTPDMPASYYRQQKADELQSLGKSLELLPTPPTYPKPIPLKPDLIEPEVISKPYPTDDSNSSIKLDGVDEAKNNNTIAQELTKPSIISSESPQPEPAPHVEPSVSVVAAEKSIAITSVKPSTESPPTPSIPIVIATTSNKKEENQNIPDIPTPSVIKASHPQPIKPPMELPVESVIKCQDILKLDDRVSFKETTINDYKHYRLEDTPKERSMPLSIKDENQLVNNIDFGRMEKMKGLENQEDDFSEPETDLKSESDIVTNLLKSDSLTRGLSIDDSTPETEKLETNFEPFIEKKIEAVSVIKEMDLNQKQVDPFGPQTQLELLSVHKENHSNFMAKVIRADTGFWSDKEVNIDSVIKKVDALCSAEDDATEKQPWFPPIKDETNPPDTKLEHVERPKTPVEVHPTEKVEVTPPIKEEPGSSSPPKDVNSPTLPEGSPSEEHSESEHVTPEGDSRVLSEDDQSELSTPRGAGAKGRRGVGGRRKTPTRAATSVATRRTRLRQQSDGSVSPRRGGRPAKGGHARGDVRGKLPTDVYEFHDDSEDEGGDKNRPRLIMTIKSPAGTEAVETDDQAPASNTRKSRRLQERDGSRTTVDDTIEDVVRGAAVLTRSAAANARRQAKPSAAVSPRASSQPAEPRKSPRASKRPTPNRTSESQDESDNKSKPDDVPSVTKPVEPPAKVPEPDVVVKPVEVITPSAKPVPVVKLPVVPPGMMLKPKVPGETEEPMTLIDPVTGLLIPMRESEEGQYIPVTSAGGRALPESVDSSLAAQAARARALSLATSGLPVPVPVISKSPVPSIVKPETKPVTLKSHMLATVKPVNLQVQPQIKVTQPGSPTSLGQPKVVAPTPVQHPKAPPPMAQSPKVHLKPPQVPSPGQNLMPQQAHMNKTMHQHPGVANPAPVPKQLMMQAPRPASPAVHATASPPKAHQGLGPPPILTGAVASPPLKSSQQPVVTGASSSRAAVPKAQVPNLPHAHQMGPHGKNMLIPPKVEVSMGGCIVVPSASGQVMQAGMPVPAYEASLHAGSGGVVAELHPNPQYVISRRQSPPPAHQHGGQGDVVQHVFPHTLRAPPHEMAQHYVHPSLMYHQYLRAAHIPYHLAPGGVRSPMMPGIDAKLEPESDEARGSSPPLELRRPASGGARVPLSLQSPHDRLTDSPQVATVYMHGSRIPHYTSRYYEPEPPPAHIRGNRHHPLPGTEAPSTQPMMQVSTPPHASQVPPQADSLLMLLQRYPVMWQGLLALKNDQAAVQMHFVFGNPSVARDSLPCNADGSTAPLRIAQRMRLEQTQVEGVARKMQMDNEHCMLLALPCGRDHMDVLQQSNNLQTGFITYLQQKQAAGIVNIAGPGSQQAAYVVHIFPSCDFANENLARIAPDLLHRVADIAHLLIIIATV